MSWKVPVKTEWMREQSSHEPSMRYAEDIHRVAKALGNTVGPFTALEIGAAWGFSTLAILEAGAKHLTSVDNNLNIMAPSEAEANGYGDKYVWDGTRSEEYWKTNTTEFDLVYIDGSHLYVDVVNDLYEGWKRTKPGGIMMADDWDHKKNIKAENDTTEYGVSLACFEFWRDHQEDIAEVGIEGRILWFLKRKVKE